MKAMLRTFGKRFIYVLIAALLLAQQGAALHALSHGVEAFKSASGNRSEQRAPLGERHCNLCLTYAQVGAGAAPATPVAFAAALSYAAPLASHASWRALVARAYHSRAPPRAV